MESKFKNPSQVQIHPQVFSINAFGTP
uniref:Uncharacterized protein n=1 Tax=Rhizophora mucronata TaxID=61149 RepID=A0A2P2NYQ0_RHIMU